MVLITNRGPYIMPIFWQKRYRMTESNMYVKRLMWVKWHVSNVWSLPLERLNLEKVKLLRYEYI